MAKYSIEGSTLTDIANAIRTQYGEDSPIAVADMAEAILGIEGGGGEESDIPSAFTLTTESFRLSSQKNLQTGSENGLIINLPFDDMPDFLFITPASRKASDTNRDICYIGVVFSRVGGSAVNQIMIYYDTAYSTFSRARTATSEYDKDEGILKIYSASGTAYVKSDRDYVLWKMYFKGE